MTENAELESLRRELEVVRREKEQLARRLDERRQLDSLRQVLRDCATFEEVAERGTALTTALLDGAPSVLLFEEVARPGFSVSAAAGLARELDGSTRAVFVERTSPLAGIANGQVLIHSPEAPIDGIQQLAGAMGTERLIVAAIYVESELVGLLATAADVAVKDRLAEAAEELSFAAAAALRAQSRAEELALREAQEAQTATLLLDIEKRDREIQAELVQAHKFQQLLIALPQVRGVKVHALYEPMGLIGGDVYALTQLSDRIRIFIADATGHGIRAALTTMIIKSGYESFLHLDSPASLLQELNNNIASTYRSSEMLFTASCVDVHTGSGAVELACAGHPPACVVRGTELLLLEVDGAPMGVKGGMSYANTTTSLARGDGLYLVTDGIAEARVRNDCFGEARLNEIVRSAHVAGEDVARKVREELLDFVGPHGLTDDASLLGIRLE